MRCKREPKSERSVTVVNLPKPRTFCQAIGRSKSFYHRILRKIRIRHRAPGRQGQTGGGSLCGVAKFAVWVKCPDYSSRMMERSARAGGIRGQSMHKRTISTATVRGGLAWSGVAWSLLLTGCCGALLTSVRVRPPVGHTPNGTAGTQVAASSADIAAPDDGCAIPPEGYCGADDCPSLLVCAKPHLGKYLGPAAHWRRGALSSEGLIAPPHSRFHPVPTTPVFAQRDTYEPPQPHLPPPPRHGHALPHVLPHRPGAVPLPLPPTPADLDPRLSPIPFDTPQGSALPEAFPSTPPDQTGATREERSVLIWRR
jgi:hypothetical protein